MDAGLTLDHAVLLVEDLEAAVDGWTGAGFTVQRGGRHAAGSTHNALVGLADGSYLELIAFLHPDPSHRWHRWAAQQRYGLVDLALLPQSVAGTVARARAAGVVYGGPLDGGRTRPDGEVARWQIATPPDADLPFLCGDLTPRALRVREGEVRLHPNGVTGVASVTWLVADLAVSAARWQALLDRPPLLPATALSGCGLHQAVFPVGPTALVLVSPGPAADDPQARALRGRLARVGQGPMGMALQGRAAGALPDALSPGAPLELVAPQD